MKAQPGDIHKINASEIDVSSNAALGPYHRTIIDNQTYAASLPKTLGTQFYIRVNLQNSAWDLFDPSFVSKANNMGRSFGRPDRFLQVNETIYANYLNYLESKNKSHLAKVNQAIKNGGYRLINTDL